MGNIRLVSPVLTELMAALQAEIPAAVAAVNAAYADDVVLVAPRSYKRGDRVQLLPSETPALLVIGDDTNVLADNDKGLDLRHLVVIGVYFTDRDEESLHERGARYAEVVVNMLADHRAGAGGGFSFRLHFAGTGQAISYSPRRVPDDRLFEADVFVPIVCDRQTVR